MKRVASLVVLVLIGIAGILQTVPVFAAEGSISSSSQERSPKTVVIRDMADLMRVAEEDRREYENKVNAIDSQLKGDVEEYLQNRKHNNYKERWNVEVEEFLQRYPQYQTWDRNELEEQVLLAANNAVVIAVRAFFNANHYTFALYLFDHSLNDSPSNLVFETFLYGDSPMKQRIRALLNAESVFRDKLSMFINYSIVSTGGAFYLGDLFYAIHNYDLSMTLVNSSECDFAIDDTYDFEGIENVAASVAGSHSYHVKVKGRYSLSQWIYK